MESIILQNNADITAINKALVAAKAALSVQFDAASKTLTTAYSAWNSASKSLEQLDFDNLDALAAAKYADASQVSSLVKA